MPPSAGGSCAGCRPAPKARRRAPLVQEGQGSGAVDAIGAQPGQRSGTDDRALEPVGTGNRADRLFFAFRRECGLPRPHAMTGGGEHGAQRRSAQGGQGGKSGLDLGRPNPKQAEFLSSNHRYTAYGGARAAARAGRCG